MLKMMQKKNKILFILSLLLIFVGKGFAAEVRIKDLANLRGNRTNELMGFGLVVGLNATGDSPASAATSAAMGKLMARLGGKVDNNQILTQSVAAVVVTGQLKAFARSGDELDVKLSIIGDAVSLEGGTLLMTPMTAADGNIYAMARGPVVVSKPSDGTAASLTNAIIPNGGQIERSFVPTILNAGKLNLILKQADFTTSHRMALAVNQFFKEFIAKAKDSSLVEVKVPSGYGSNIVSFVSKLETITVEPDTIAQVVINERTGTVVMGGDVRIAPIAFSHNGLDIRVGGDGSTNSINELKGSTVSDLMTSLNALGTKPSDLINILQAIHAAGALQAELKYL